MAQSDARFGYKANLNREMHDLSRTFGFTCPPGSLLPIFADIATPGDTYYIKHDLTFLRTLPLAAPAMVDINVHFESFFVPMQMIYQPFENTQFSLTNIQSSNFTRASMMNSQFPEFNYSAYRDDMITNHGHTSYRFDAFRLADMLGLDAYNFQDTSHFVPGFFPWQILAYNTIFQYYYRLDDKSQFDNANCNWDKYYSTSSVTPMSITFMTVHQRPWDFDYFTSIYRSPIVSDSNAQSILPIASYSALLNSGSNHTTPVGYDGGDATSNSNLRAFSSSLGSTYSESFSQGAFSTSLIRQMFANEKLAMITGRTKKNYDSQVLAHYGINVPHDVKHDLTMIGKDSFPIHIGEVTSLASTSDAPLGELAGKGWCQSPQDVQQHKFTAPCHGVIMTIFSVEPRRRYYGGFQRENAITKAYDLPTPEFDRMGNVPMFRYEVGQLSNATSTFYDLIGWKERYYYFKRKPNRSTLAFMRGNRVSGVNSVESYMISTPPFGEPLYTPTPSYSAYPEIESTFYISPNSVDGIMLVNYHNGWISNPDDPDKEDWSRSPWLPYARDPFIVDCYEKVKKVSWMSKDGEPIYPF